MILRLTPYFSLLLILTLVTPRHVEAQSGIELVDVRALVRFGEQITFIATIKSFVPIQSVSIVISDASQNTTYVEPLTVQTDGRTEFHFDTKQNLLRPFTTVEWNYQIGFPDGTTVQSGSFFVRYSDDRFPWQTLAGDTLTIHWYQGDSNFGEAALDAAQAGLESIRRLMTLDLTQPIEIFIYANPDDFRATLVQGKDEWIAGHIDPALGVVMVLVEPGAEQGIAMEQRIPHELMHVMLQRRVGSGYDNVPAWLREGAATLVEMYPNVEYDRVLADAAAGDHLIPIQDLCSSFPADPGQVFLAYAESRSFTDYLRRTYGATGLLNLAASYADGVDCEHGTKGAFGVSLSTLEANWRSSALGENTFLSSLQNISPYLALLCLVLMIPLLGIVSTLRKKGSQNESGTSIRK